MAWPGRSMKTRRKVVAAIAALAAALALAQGAIDEARAEYGDIVMNNYSDGAGMRPVIFPHWFHRVRFRCKACHTDLGIKFKAGGNEINMLKIIDGQFCGACHNGSVAWPVENCDLCHSARPGMPTHVHGSTVNLLDGPAASPGGAPGRAAPGTPPAAGK